jgi:hypothetical protein
MWYNEANKSTTSKDDDRQARPLGRVAARSTAWCFLSLKQSTTLHDSNAMAIQYVLMDVIKRTLLIGAAT